MNFNDRFMAKFEAVCQDIRLRENLDRALEQYNELFIPGAEKILILISKNEFDRINERERRYREEMEKVEKRFAKG